MSRLEQFLPATEKQIHFYRILGASEEAVEKLAASPLEVATKMITQKLEEIYHQGARVQDKEGRQGVITAQFPNRQGQLSISIKWDDEPQAVNRTVSDWRRSGVEPIGEVDKALQEATDFRERLFQQIGRARKDLEINVKITRGLQKGIMQFAQQEVAALGHEPSNDELYDIAVKYLQDRRRRGKI